MKLKSVIKQIPRKIYQLITILFITGSIFFYMLLLVGLFFYRIFATLLAKVFRKRFLGPIKGFESFLSADNLFKCPNATLVHLAILGNTPKPEVILKHLQLIYDLEDGRKYERLGQTVEPWMGYLYWKNVKNFQIQNCLHFINRENYKFSEENVSEFVQQLIRKPFERNQPLWEVIVVSTDALCYVFFRTHHLLLDGVSYVKLWYSFDTLENDNLSTKELPEKLFSYKASKDEKKLESRWERLRREVKVLFVKSPYLSRKILYGGRDKNCLSKEYKELSPQWWCSGVNKIHVEEYRQSLRTLGFTLTHALLVGYSRGFKSYLKDQYGEGKLPRKFHILGSVPRSNYPHHKALANHWYYFYNSVFPERVLFKISISVFPIEVLFLIDRAIMRYKANTQGTLMEELEAAKGEYRRSVTDIVPEAFEINHKYVIPLIPGWLFALLWETERSGSLSLSNIPGPTTRQKMFGEIVRDRVIWLPLTRHNSGIGLLMLTYNGWATISLTADSGCIKTKEQFNKLNYKIVQELQNVLDEVKILAELKIDELKEDQISDDVIKEMTEVESNGLTEITIL